MSESPALHSGSRWLLRLVVMATALWGAMAMYFLLRLPSAAVWALIVAWLGLAGWALSGLRVQRTGWAGVQVYAVALLCMQVTYWSMPPRQDRLWANDVAQKLRVEIHGNRVVMHNVRNFDWRSDTDYDARWETREYDLDHLANADLAMSYWMGPAIAHTLVSFGFDDGSRVVFSLEIRKERGESFSALGGFFRKFEQTLVAADERDILRVRTNARGEDMYLYRLNIPREKLREAFRGYLARAVELDRQPRFYNTVTSNCTTIVYALARHIAPRLPLDWRLLASGWFSDYAYEQGGLLPGYNFEQLKQGGHITERARAAGDAQDFSQRIRQGMPLQPRKAVQ